MTSPQNNLPKFPLGEVVATPGVLEILAESGQSPAEFLARHVHGDWGDVCAEDKARTTRRSWTAPASCRRTGRPRA